MVGPTPNYDTVQVRGAYVNTDNTPTTGTVTFTPTVLRLVDSGSKIIVVGKAIVAPLVDGEFTVELPATDDPDISPTAFSYQVKENFTGGQEFFIDVPMSAIPDGLDMATLTPLDTPSAILATPVVFHWSTGDPEPAQKQGSWIFFLGEADPVPEWAPTNTLIVRS